MRIPGDHQVDPRIMGQALLSEIENHRNLTINNTSARNIDFDKHTVKLATQETIHAERVIITAGLQTNELLP